LQLALRLDGYIKPGQSILSIIFALGTRNRLSPERLSRRPQLSSCLTCPAVSVLGRLCPTLAFVFLSETDLSWKGGTEWPLESSWQRALPRELRWLSGRWDLSWPPLVSPTISLPSADGGYAEGRKGPGTNLSRKWANCRGEAQSTKLLQVQQNTHVCHKISRRCIRVHSNSNQSLLVHYPERRRMTDVVTPAELLNDLPHKGEVIRAQVAAPCCLSQMPESERNTIGLMR